MLTKKDCQLAALLRETLKGFKNLCGGFIYNLND